MASHQPKTLLGKASLVQERSRGAAFGLGMLLVAMTFAFHFPATRAGYTWDDGVNLYRSPLILARDGLWKLRYTTEAPAFIPLTRATFWIEWRLWGDNPRPYHVVNIILHALAAVVLWRVLVRLRLNSVGAFLGALFFAVHPVTVESVAWISERKNVLSMVLCLLSILFYLRFEDQRDVRWYAFALLAAVAALLAKTAVAALPLVLLICVWWRSGRVTRADLLRTVPFLLTSLVLGLIELWFEYHNSIAGAVVRPEGLASRIASVGWVVWFYLYKIVLPIHLAMIYPRWDIDGGRVLSYVPLGSLIAGLAGLWVLRKRWSLGPFVAVASFVIMLLPVLGLLDLAYAEYSLVADHLQYPGMPGLMAVIGGCLGAAWSWARQKGGHGLAVGVAAMAGALVLGLGLLTWRQARVYRSEVTLWSHTIAINDRAWVAYVNRGSAYSEKAAYDLAIQDYSRAIDLKPENADAYYNRGVVYDHKGAYDLAIQDYSKAIDLKTQNADAYYTYCNRGNAYGRKGEHDLAIQDFSQAILLEPSYAEAYNNRGRAHSKKGAYDLAIEDYSQAIALKPSYAEAYNNRGSAQGKKGAYHLAVLDYSRAIDLRPDYAEAYSNRAVGFYLLKQYEQAWADVRTCRQFGGTPHPDFITALIEVTGRKE